MKCHNKWSSFKGICGDLTSPYVKGLQDQKLLVDYGTCNTISGHWYRGIACNLVAQCFGILRLFDFNFSFSDTKKVGAIGGLTIEYQYPRHLIRLVQYIRVYLFTHDASIYTQFNASRQNGHVYTRRNCPVYQ